MSGLCYLCFTVPHQMFKCFYRIVEKIDNEKHPAIRRKII